MRLTEGFRLCIFDTFRQADHVLATICVWSAPVYFLQRPHLVYHAKDRSKFIEAIQNVLDCGRHLCPPRQCQFDQQDVGLKVMRKRGRKRGLAA